MFNKIAFPSFNSTKNSSQSDILFLEKLEKTRNDTQSIFACFSVIDFKNQEPVRLNYVSYPAEWASHIVTHFNGENDFFLDTNFNENSIYDWREFKQDSHAAKLYRHIRSNGLGKNGVSVSHPLGSERCGVLSLSFQTSDRNWPFHRTYNLKSYQAQAARIAGHYQKFFQCDRKLEHPITKREIQCLSWVAQGKTDVQIAQELGVTKWTVVTHLINARRKLQSPNRASAVAVAISKGIITL